ncbi:MAG: hypothetical protein A2Y95_01265 [Deltaproteobacteria bacterium RBG_13_65_10]|nr:MAG: hypothetical protein A2Y95_01265 [Deltaproteobacteria bacterium RBG_13_65_10]
MKHRKRLALSVWLLASFLLLSGRAAAEGPPRLTIQEALIEALRANPEIAAAEHAWRAERERPRQEGSLEDPRFRYEAHNTPRPLALDEAAETRYGVAQAIPFPWKLHLRAKAARAEADAVRQRYEQKRLEIAARVKTAYADLYQAERNIEITGRIREVARNLVDTAQARYETGEAPQQDLLKAQLALTQVGRDLNTLEEDRLRALARLNALMDRPQAMAARTVTDLPVRPLLQEVEALERDAAAERPAVKAAALEVDRAETERRLARLRYVPDFEIAGERRVNRGSDNGYGAMLMVTVPWVWSGKHRAANTEAIERKREAASALRAEQNATAMGVREMFARADRAYRNAELLRTALVPQARLTLESSRASYEAGETDFLNVLDGLQSVLYLETQQVQEVATWTAGVAGIEEMVGHALQ